MLKPERRFGLHRSGVPAIPLAYINRPIPRDDMGDTVDTDLRDPLLFSAGGDVYLRRPPPPPPDKSDRNRHQLCS